MPTAKITVRRALVSVSTIRYSMKNILSFAILITIFLTGCKSKEEKIIDQYVAAENWEEKINYCIESPKLEESMRTYYRNWPSGITRTVKSLKKIKAMGQEIADWGLYSAVVEAKMDDNSVNSFNLAYYLENTTSGPKIDWFATTGMNNPGIMALKANPPKNAVDIRVECQLSDYYNYDKRGKDKLEYSVEIIDVNSKDRFHGYIPKDSDEGRKIFDVLKDGQPHKLLLSVRLSEYFSNTSICDILYLEAIGWKK